MCIEKQKKSWSQCSKCFIFEHNNAILFSYSCIPKVTILLTHFPHNPFSLCLWIMAISNLGVQTNHHFHALQFFIFSLILFKVHSLSFTFPNFQPNNPDLFVEGDSSISNDVIQLTTNQVDASLTESAGRASYAKPIRLWDASTGQVM